MLKKEFIILNIDTKEIKMTDLNRTLEELGYTVVKTYLDYNAEEYCTEAVQEVRIAICGSKADCVITYDFYQSISEACLLEDVPYIAWVFDAPQKELFTPQAFYPCNYIYVFDKKQQIRLQQIGVENVYHTALAFKGNGLADRLREAPKEEDMCQISFVGKLYWQKNSEKFIDGVEFINQDYDRMHQNNFMQWDDEKSMFGKMGMKSTLFLQQYEKVPMKERYPFVSDTYLYETAIFSRALAHRERVYILNRLAKKYDVSLYTRDEDVSELSTNVKIHPGIPYQKAFDIYHNTKINLNITLHCIETGVPQRVFDVLASGGFLLSNYQQELVELFEPGKELAVYHNMEELEELVEYYLTHEEERRAIALAGQKKVLQLHDYHDKLEQIVSFVREREQERKTSYAENCKSWFWERIDVLLRNRKEEWLKYLASMCNSDKLTQFAGDRKGLLLLKQMQKIKSSPLTFVEEELYKNITSVRDIEEYYDDMADVARFLQKDGSVLFLYWILSRQEGVGMDEMCELTRQMAFAFSREAIEFVSYAIMENQNVPELYLQKADCLLELGMVEEALNVLRAIPEPNEEIGTLIKEMEAFLIGE